MPEHEFRHYLCSVRSLLDILHSCNRTVTLLPRAFKSSGAHSHQSCTPSTRLGEIQSNNYFFHDARMYVLWGKRFAASLNIYYLLLLLLLLLLFALGE